MPRSGSSQGWGPALSTRCSAANIMEMDPSLGSEVNTFRSMTSNLSPGRLDAPQRSIHEMRDVGLPGLLACADGLADLRSPIPNRVSWLENLRSLPVQPSKGPSSFYLCCTFQSGIFKAIGMTWTAMDQKDLPGLTPEVQWLRPSRHRGHRQGLRLK
jgi:hypothetical protein